MSRAAAPFRSTDVKRAAKAAQACGLTVSGVEIAPDGTIRILTAAGAQPQVDKLEAWRARRDAHKAEGA